MDPEADIGAAHADSLMAFQTARGVAVQLAGLSAPTEISSAGTHTRVIKK
jgi:hypothetical protein